MTTTPGANRIGELIIHLKCDFKNRLRLKLKHHQTAIRELHGMVVPYVAINGPCRMVDIADHCNVRPQSMATAISELETMGYLSRQPSEQDLRAKLIVLTEQGKTLFAHLNSTTMEIWQDYEAIVGKKRLTQLLSTIDQLVHAHDSSSRGFDNAE